MQARKHQHTCEKQKKNPLFGFFFSSSLGRKVVESKAGTCMSGVMPKKLQQGKEQKKKSLDGFAFWSKREGWQEESNRGGHRELSLNYAKELEHMKNKRKKSHLLPKQEGLSEKKL